MALSRKELRGIVGGEKPVLASLGQVALAKTLARQDTIEGATNDDFIEDWLVCVDEGGEPLSTVIIPSTNQALFALAEEHNLSRVELVNLLLWHGVRAIKHPLRPGYVRCTATGASVDNKIKWIRAVKNHVGRGLKDLKELSEQTLWPPRSSPGTRLAVGASVTIREREGNKLSTDQITGLVNELTSLGFECKAVQ